MQQNQHTDAAILRRAVFVKEAKMQNRIANLLTVKSIVTVVLTAVFSVLALRGTISGTEFLTIFTTVIAFYFGTQTEKKKNE